MGRPRLFETTLAPIRVTRQFEDELRRAAESRGLTVSDYIRHTLTAAVRRDLRREGKPRG